MTEKRFKLFEDKETIIDKKDKETYWTFECIQVEKLVDLLNELNDENAELHIQLDFLKDENRHMRDLVNENKQLKDDVYDWKASAEDYLKLGKSLKKENERLREQNENLLEKLKFTCEQINYSENLREMLK